ncbi:hypothetical protein BRC84_05685 [Halobacteriales archaeon QS_1_68_44]|nr:MAG: hypothetical protein BRC84_05685 [Halobacteriales archaeon QS_1_68_44]
MAVDFPRDVLGRMFANRQKLAVQSLSLCRVFSVVRCGAGGPESRRSGRHRRQPWDGRGFIPLSVSRALSETTEDTVIGVYLLRDPDFEVGDRVEVDRMEGSVAAVELGKSRFVRENGDTTVLANRDVKAEQTKRAERTWP